MLEFDRKNKKCIAITLHELSKRRKRWYLQLPSYYHLHPIPYCGQKVIFEFTFNPLFKLNPSSKPWSALQQSSKIAFANGISRPPHRLPPKTLLQSRVLVCLKRQGTCRTVVCSRKNFVLNAKSLFQNWGNHIYLCAWQWSWPWYKDPPNYKLFVIAHFSLLERFLIECRK